MSTRRPAVTRSRPIRLVTEEVIASVRVERSAEECFEVYSQLDRVPEWSVGIGQIEIVSETRSEWTASLPRALQRVLPKISWASEQCVKPDECVIEWKSVSGISNNGKVNFQALSPNACNFTMVITYTMPDWLRPIVTSGPARAYVRSTVNSTVEKFRAIIEAEGQAAGAADGSDNTEARLEAMRVEQRVSTVTAALTAALGSSDIGLLGATIEEAEAASVDGSSVQLAAAKARLEELLAAEAARIEQLVAKPAVEEVGKAAGAAGAADAPGTAGTADMAGTTYTSTVAAEIEIACSAREACFAYGDIENFPTYAPLLKSVRIVGEGRSEWELQLPWLVVRLVRVVGMGRLIKWEAAYVVESPKRLVWQSLSGFENAGVATFEPLGDDRCRTVVNMTYSVPLTLKPLEQSPWVKRFMASTMQGAMESFQLSLETGGRLGGKR